MSVPPFLTAKTNKMTNQLYQDDYLQVLRDCIATESVDLGYLDPPFAAVRRKLGFGAFIPVSRFILSRSSSRKGSKIS